MIPYILAAVGGYLIGDSLKGKQYAERRMMAKGGSVDSEDLYTKKQTNNIMAKQKEISIDDLIRLLEQEVKAGATKVQIKGTLLCEQNGNNIIISTEKQM